MSNIIRDVGISALLILTNTYTHLKYDATPPKQQQDWINTLLKKLFQLKPPKDSVNCKTVILAEMLINPTG